MSYMLCTILKKTSIMSPSNRLYFKVVRAQFVETFSKCNGLYIGAFSI